jgi:uncharacterized membrane protein YphA (DoxX/SURF4 family)
MASTSSPGARISQGERAIEILRIGLGVIWGLNLLFIVVPASDYWGTFTSIAASFGASTPGGPGFANYVASHSLFFAWTIAIATAYLAVAFVAGVTTRLACVVGIVASAIFLWTQYTTTFSFPGGTDVGPHPLYIVMSLILLLGGAGRYWSVDQRLWRTGRVTLRKIGRWVAGPPPFRNQ